MVIDDGCIYAMIHSLKTSGAIMKVAVSKKELFWNVRDLCVQHGMTIHGKFPPQKEELNKSKIPGVVVVEDKK